MDMYWSKPFLAKKKLLTSAERHTVLPSACIADVWTHPAFRRRGIAMRMLRELLRRLHHYHFYVFTDPLCLDLYAKIGFTLADKQPISMGKTRLVGRTPRFIKPPG